MLKYPLTADVPEVVYNGFHTILFGLDPSVYRGHAPNKGKKLCVNPITKEGGEVGSPIHLRTSTSR
jgi:hypothetical protein